MYEALVAQLQSSVFVSPLLKDHTDAHGATQRKQVHTKHSCAQAPSFTVNPHNKDVYSAYNKPEAVIDWLAHNEVRRFAPIPAQILALHPPSMH